MASEERSWDQTVRRFQLEESTTLNNGARTIFIEHMTPNTTVPPHVHHRFSEIFDLISGSMSVYTHKTPDLNNLEASATQLEIGKKVTIEQGMYHKYKAGDQDTVLRVTLTPGDVDFERVCKIFNGLGAEGQLERMGDSLVFGALAMELCDAHVIGPVGDVLEGVRREKMDEIVALRRELLEKYDTEEELQDMLVEKS